MMIFALIMWLVHPMHVSLIDIIDQDQGLEVTVSIFADDLELAVKNEFGSGHLDILEVNKYEEEKVWVRKYVDKHLKLSVSDELLELKFLGYHLEYGKCIIKLEGTIRSDQEISINSTLLLNEFTDQKNLVRFNINGQEESYLLDHSRREIKLKI